MIGKEYALRPLWLMLVGIALLSGLAFQGSRGLYETTEGRYAECAREMLERGNYFEPTLSYQYHWSKPPLTYWMTAAGMRLFGENELGARFLNGLAFSLTVLTVAALAAALWGQTAGLAAGLIYASSPLPMLAAFALSADTFLTLFEVLAVLCYVKASRTSAPHSRAWIMAMWAAFGLGFLTKGPPALIPLLPLAIWHVRRRPENVQLASPIGVAAFAVIGLGWYAVSCLQHPGLLAYFLGRETFDRIASESNRNPQWYQPFRLYLPLLTFGGGVWLYFMVRSVIQARLHVPARLWEALRGSGVGSFLLLWLIPPLALFFVVKSRLPLYILPLYAPIALAAARAATRNAPTARSIRHVIVVAAVSVCVLIAARGLYCHNHSRNDMKSLYETCRRTAAGSSQVIAMEPHLFGLQFYLGGRLERISMWKKEAWADDTAEHLVEKIRSAPSAASYLVVTDKGFVKPLSELLDRAGILFRRIEVDKWVLVSVPVQHQAPVASPSRLSSTAAAISTALP